MEIIDNYSAKNHHSQPSTLDISEIRKSVDHLYTELKSGKIVLEDELEALKGTDDKEINEKIAQMEKMLPYQRMGVNTIHKEVIELFHNVRKGRDVPELNEKMEGLEMRLKQLQNEPKHNPHTQKELKDIQHKMSVIKIILLSPEKQLDEAAKQNLTVTEKQIAHGAAKAIHAKGIPVPFGKKTVYVPIGDKVRIFPVNGLQYYVRREEINQEIAKAETIRNELETLENVERREQGKIKRLCTVIKQLTGQEVRLDKLNYESLEDFLDGFETDPFLDKQEKAAIKEFLQDPQNELIIDTLKDPDLHLALDTTVKEDEKGGQYLEADRAVGDLSTVLKNYTLTMQERGALCYSLLDGLANLHSTGKDEKHAGNFHGDEKPQNVLVSMRIVNGKRYFIAKTSDFGKTENIPLSGQLGPEPLHYSGNKRWRNTENVGSQYGDVESMAFMLVHVNERPFLDKSGRLGEQFPYDLKNKREEIGIVNTLCTSPACTQNDCNFAATKVADYINTDHMIMDTDVLKGAEKVKHAYISTVSEKMQQGVDETRQKAVQEFEMLLKDMTQANPFQRPSAEEALDRFPLLLLRLPETTGVPR